MRLTRGRPNIDTGDEFKVQKFKVQVSTLASRLILGVQLQAEVGKIASCGIAVLTIGQQQLPDDARLHLAHGVLSVQIGEIEIAIRDFQRAHELDLQLSFVASPLLRSEPSLLSRIEPPVL
jgi:hypothetical protein